MDILRCIAGAFYWIRIVFTYGEVREDETISRKKSDDGCERRQMVGRISYNGLISSIQMFILLMAVSSSLILAAYKSHTYTYETANMVVLVLLMMSGMGVTSGFWRYGSKLVAPENNRPTDADRRLQDRNNERNGEGGRKGEVEGDGRRGGREGRRREVGTEGREGERGNGYGEGAEVEGRGERSEDERGKEARGRAGREERGGRERKGREGREGGGRGGRGSRVVIIGLIVFYICGTLLDLLQIVASTFCSVMLLRTCDHPDSRFHLVIHFMFHLFRVIYLGFVALFCLRFYLSNFLDLCLVRYGLMFLQAVNLSLWFDATAHRRSEDDFSVWALSEHHYNCLGSANSTNATGCLTNSFYLTVNKDFSPLVRPFMIQFTLLVANFFCQWFFNCVKVKRNGSEQRDEDSEETSNFAYRMSIDDLPREDVVISRNGELEEWNGMEKEEPGEKSPLVRRAQRAPRSAGFQLWLVAIIVINSLLITFSFSVTKRSFLYYCLLFYWISMFLAIGVGFHVSRRFEVREEALEFTGLDYLLLFTSTGPIAFNVFTLIAIIDAGRGKTNYIGGSGLCFSLLFVFFDLTQSYIQVAFSLYAGRVVVDARDARQTRDAAYFRGIVFYLAVSNGALWIVNTLNDINVDQSIQKAFFGHDMWVVIYNIIKPLSLFFHFNSCLLFTRAFRRRHPNTKMAPEMRRRAS